MIDERPVESCNGLLQVDGAYLRGQLQALFQPKAFQAARKPWLLEQIRSSLHDRTAS